MTADNSRSYQKNGVDRNKAEETTPLMGASHERSPVDLLEQNKRTRLCLSLVLISFFLGLISVLAVWQTHRTKEIRAAQRNSEQAEAALKRLNHHLGAQSKRIHKGCETTILLTRHCEKVGPTVEDEDGNQHCSYIGLERAQHLATLFGRGRKTRWPTPSHMFALTPDRKGHLNYREWESLHPLSTKTGLTTELVRDSTALVDTYMDMLQSGTLCGQVTLVSWKHEYIPGLAVALGCSTEHGCPPMWSEDSFDEVWQLKFVFHAPKISHEAESNLTTTSLDNNSTRRRFLKKHHRNPVKEGWTVYGNVAYQYFDPLAFSKQVGDYPEEGTSSGGQWRDEI